QKAMGYQNLAFASQQYRKLLEVNPQDQLALKMRDKIINLATVSFVPQKREFEDRGKGSSQLFFLIGILLVLAGGFSKMPALMATGGFLLLAGIGIRIWGRQ